MCRPLRGNNRGTARILSAGCVFHSCLTYCANEEMGPCACMTLARDLFHCEKKLVSFSRKESYFENNKRAICRFGDDVSGLGLAMSVSFLT